jgi:septal ring factor EnvC (AmiA/AmiB activator)
MTADIDHLILEHLKHIRARVDHLADDMTEVKHRLNQLEFAASRARTDTAYTEESIARQQVTIDRFSTRLTHIERRLELSDSLAG